eukprot:CAMPEP_0194265836 /NCGR_PEP_ID=MMETSP0169-20130528/940_1 /TAXON_ID=218684 /ORGANISM="Corethron pennatum, Strain L29A3" /LENGTH=263 /DNA_ID=CAMNT_0039006389 /DNA_START=80 /DNA_END=871 /DNA_ORIENTATION=-
MKISLLALATIVGTAAAGLPELSLQVRDGSFADLDGLDPTLKWSVSTSTGDLNLEAGIEASVRPTTDIASLPRAFWGKASQDIGAWGVSAQADVSASDLKSADIEISAENSVDDLSVKLLASAGDGFSVSSVEATKKFASGDATISVNPRYDVSSGSGDVVLGYDAGETSIEVTASADEQSVTVSRQVDDSNRISPTLALQSKDFSVEWERSLDDGNSVTTTVTPNQAIDIEWNDAAWTANVNLPIDDGIGGANVSIKRELNF